MHVRISTRRRGEKVYRYVQLVQSYRRDDGMPAHKVLATLGDLPQHEVDNLKLAIKASREGKQVVLPDQLAQRLPTKVRANLQYLDVAAVDHLWQQWQLGPLLDDLLPDSAADVPDSAVVEALVVQRCVAPDSKLQAQRWYPKTALPELQGIAPGKVHNTRIHRALEQLELIEQPLQEELARRIHARGALTAVYLDATDTWFVGRGPDLARKRITKEGMLRRRIGIVLLCDTEGYPLRWATVAGSHHEAASMMDQLRQVADQPWMAQVPLVVDRAMGRGVSIGALCSHDVRFVTAVPAPEIPSYSPDIPLGAFDAAGVDGADRDDDDACKQLQQAAAALGFVRVSDERYVLDLGVLDRTGDLRAVDEGDHEAMAGAPTRAVTALRTARRLQHELDVGAARNLEELATRYECSRHALQHWRVLLDLTDEVQQRIETGDAGRLDAKTLARIVKLRSEEQLTAFQQAIRDARDKPILWPTRELEQFALQSPVRIRGVALFNPQRFLEQRQAAQEQLGKLRVFVDDLNQRLRSPSSRRKRDSVLAAIGAELRHRHWTSLFDVQVDSVPWDGRTVMQVTLRQDDEAWQQRHRTDGLTLIVAHPDIPGTAAELAALYFAKDQVEKDFQTIKSVLELRPVRHRTDHKVRAHVTLCMLALLLERSLERQLRDAGAPMTAAAALDELRCCHLNLYADPRDAIYSVTEPTPDQRSILAALGREDLADDDAVRRTITPR